MSMIERIKDRRKELVELEKSSINMTGMVISFRDVKKLLDLYDVVEAAKYHAWKCVDHEHYHISDHSWENIMAALKAIKEAE